MGGAPFALLENRKALVAVRHLRSSMLFSEGIVTFRKQVDIFQYVLMAALQTIPK